MNLSDIEKMDKEFLRAEDIAPVLGIKPHYIRLQAHDKPELLGFPTIATGNRTLIPKEGFLYFCRYGRPIQA